MCPYFNIRTDSSTISIWWHRNIRFGAAGHDSSLLPLLAEMLQFTAEEKKRAVAGAGKGGWLALFWAIVSITSCRLIIKSCHLVWHSLRYLCIFSRVLNYLVAHRSRPQSGPPQANYRLESSLHMPARTSSTLMPMFRLITAGVGTIHIRRRVFSSCTFDQESILLNFTRLDASSFFHVLILVESCNLSFSGFYNGRQSSSM